MPVLMDRLRADARPLIMGILNATPDSFSDGGRFFVGQTIHVDRLMAVATQMVADGADLLDIGGESTRPGADAVSTRQELDRVVPVIEALSQRLEVPLSVDTSDPVVMTESVQAGACLINDVRALARPGALSAAAVLARDFDVAVCLMHMRGEPDTMSTRTHYDQLLPDIRAELADRIQWAEQAGIPRTHLLIDPGFGFAKTTSQNFQLLKNLSEFAALELPLMVGLSRKRMIGEVTGQAVSDRMVASVALALMAVERGARVVRVHDVAATRDALQMLAAMQSS